MIVMNCENMYKDTGMRESMVDKLDKRENLKSRIKELEQELAREKEDHIKDQDNDAALMEEQHERVVVLEDEIRDLNARIVAARELLKKRSDVYWIVDFQKIFDGIQEVLGR